jgi:hypothetical protein
MENTDLSKGSFGSKTPSTHASYPQDPKYVQSPALTVIDDNVNDKHHDIPALRHTSRVSRGNLPRQFHRTNGDDHISIRGREHLRSHKASVQHHSNGLLFY